MGESAGRFSHALECERRAAQHGGSEARAREEMRARVLIEGEQFRALPKWGFFVFSPVSSAWS
jgi:hypothetical protein